MVNEEWRTIDGWDGYEISNLGNVRSYLLRSYNRGRATSPTAKRIQLSVWGYPEVRLFQYGKTRKFRVHRLVATAFLPNPYKKREVNHIDGDRTNNNVANLEWVSRTENMLHAYRVNNAPRMRGERNGHAKLTAADVRQIKRLWKSGKYLQRELAADFGVARTTVNAIVNNYNWTS